MSPSGIALRVDGAVMLCGIAAVQWDEAASLASTSQHVGGFISDLKSWADLYANGAIIAPSPIMIMEVQPGVNVSIYFEVFRTSKFFYLKLKGRIYIICLSGLLKDALLDGAVFEHVA